MASETSYTKLIASSEHVGGGFRHITPYCKCTWLMTKFVYGQSKLILNLLKNCLTLHEKVIWSFLTLIAKNKLDEKGTLSLISIGVPFVMNTLKTTVFVPIPAHTPITAHQHHFQFNVCGINRPLKSSHPVASHYVPSPVLNTENHQLTLC